MKRVVKQIKQIGAVYFLLVFAAIYFSHDTLLFGTNSNQLFITIRKVVPFFLAFLLFIHSTLRRIRITCGGLLISICLLSLPIASCAINGEPLNNYIYRFAIMLCALLFAVTSKKDNFLKAYNLIISFLTVWSLVFFALSNIVPGFAYLFPKVINSGGEVFYSSFFSTISFSPTYHIYRNGGLFREPGVYMCFLIFSLIIEIFAFTKTNKTRCLIFFAGLVSTLSTAGFVIALLLIICVLFSSRLISRKSKFAILAFTIFTIVFFVLFGKDIPLINSIVNKFEYGSVGYGSFFARYQSIVGNLKIAANNPLFGIGRYSLYDTVLGVDADNSNYVANSNTNTLLINFSAFGLLYGTLCLIGIARFIAYYQSRKLLIVSLFVILILAFSNEDLGQNIVYFFFVFWGLTNHLPKKSERLNSCSTRKLILKNV